MNFVDPEGSNIYIFNPNGTYNDTVYEDGEDYILWNYYDDKGTLNQRRISFIDPDNDPKMINKNTRLHFMDNQELIEILKNSGIDFSNSGFVDAISILLKESDASKGEGRLDYAGNGENNIDVEVEGNVPALYITETNRDGLFAHNGHNFGNFLWGASVKLLGVPLILGRMGAHYNSRFKDKSYHQWDSKDDQNSIKMGYRWASGK